MKSFIKLAFDELVKKRKELRTSAAIKIKSSKYKNINRDKSLEDE